MLLTVTTRIISVSSSYYDQQPADGAGQTSKSCEMQKFQ